MKKILLILAISATIPLTGCSTTWSKLFGSNPTPPTPIEKAIYSTATNFVEVPVNVTNIFTQVVTVTNTIGQIVTQTNVVTQIQTVTNTIPVYQYVTAAGTTATVTTVSSLFGPAGTAIGGSILALLALWAQLRSTKQGNAANTLSQEIETLLEFINSLPQGTKYTTAIQTWLQSHQLDTGTASTILTILENEVSNPEAKAAVADITATLTTLGTTVPKA